MILTLLLFGAGAILIGIWIGTMLNLKSHPKGIIAMNLVLAFGILWVLYALIEWRMLEWKP